MEVEGRTEEGDSALLPSTRREAYPNNNQSMHSTYRSHLIKPYSYSFALNLSYSVL